MEKDFIEAFIPSKDTKAYLHSIHHEFTNLEKATIVANHIMISYEEKVGWLKDFKDRISDEALKKRISETLIQIKKDNKKYRRKSKTALGALPYNKALFDFVFIPHDFRHGDVVRSLYGDWSTQIYAEKIGVILGYFDEDYDFYRNLQGDYSDVQICVDIKFDGASYQGEFEHEHINPIYIERMSLHENDERKTYLDYLTNTYIKRRHRMVMDNKPEYVAESMTELEQRYLDEYIPVRNAETGTWCVQSGHGFESGDIGYVAGEFSGIGLSYHFSKNGVENHVHGFNAVLEAVLEDPEHTEIINDHGECSEQEIRMVEGIKRAAEFVHLHRRPMTNAELRENKNESKV